MPKVKRAIDTFSMINQPLLFAIVPQMTQNGMAKGLTIDNKSPFLKSEISFFKVGGLPCFRK